mmetsp:Transcript_22314/g.76388  ORF Transcript_22314/g.76388 Transcript_22314/m.76388 type:complete len:359 (+) Transcript_22314:2343-3419(+)
MPNLLNRKSNCIVDFPTSLACPPGATTSWSSKLRIVCEPTREIETTTCKVGTTLRLVLRMSSMWYIWPPIIASMAWVCVPWNGLDHPKGTSWPCGGTGMSANGLPLSNGRIVILTFEERLTAAKTEPARKETASAPRIGATSALQTCGTPKPSARAPVPDGSASSLLPGVANSKKALEPAATSLQSTEPDHWQGGLQTGLKSKLVEGESSSPDLTAQCISLDVPGASSKLVPSFSGEISISCSEEFVKMSLGRNVITWHSAPNMSFLLTSSVCKQKTPGPIRVLMVKMLKLGGIRTLYEAVPLARSTLALGPAPEHTQKSPLEPRSICVQSTSAALEATISSQSSSRHLLGSSVMPFP